MDGIPSKPEEAYDKILTANLQRVLDFLKFAEAKNAALLGLASAWAVAIINLQCSGKTIPKALVNFPISGSDSGLVQLMEEFEKGSARAT